MGLQVVFDWQSRGGGFELEVHYPQWRRVHKPIDRHHSLLDSLAKLMEGKCRGRVRGQRAVLSREGKASL